MVSSPLTSVSIGAAGRAWRRRVRRRGEVRRPSPRPRPGGRTALSTGSGTSRAATTCRPRAWDGQRLGRPSSRQPARKVVPAGTPDRDHALSGVSAVTVPTAGAVRESTTRLPVRRAATRSRAKPARMAFDTQRGREGVGGCRRERHRPSGRRAGSPARLASRHRVPPSPGIARGCES